MRIQRHLTGSSLIGICLLLLANHPVRAEEPGPAGTADARQSLWDASEGGSDWADVARTFKEIRFHVVHPTVREGFAYGTFLAGAIYTNRVKGPLSDEFQEDRSQSRDAVSSTFRPLGEAVIPIVALSTYALGRLSGSDRTRRVGLILSESAGFTVLATEIGQFIFSEQRPADGGKLSFFSTGGHGISGHTSIVASMSAPLDRLFFQVNPGDGAWRRTGKYFGKAMAYSLPVMTGWSRINDNKHYAWNVVLGLGTGWMMGDFVASAHGLSGRQDDVERHWSVVPMMDDHGAPGLGIRWALP